jgi:hypothetical protein
LSYQRSSKSGSLSPAGSQDQNLPHSQVFLEGRDEGHEKDAPAKPQGEEHVATPSVSSNTENRKSGLSPESYSENIQGLRHQGQHISVWEIKIGKTVWTDLGLNLDPL